METIVELLFQTGTVRPTACPNIARVNRSTYSIVKKHCKGRAFDSIQKCVDEHGLHLDSVEAFMEAINLGYCAYQMSLHPLIRNRCHVDVLKYCIYNRRIKILPGAIVEAMRSEDSRYVHILTEATSREVIAEAVDWILEEKVPILQPLALLRRL
jgi:hypothetical protein